MEWHFHICLISGHVEKATASCQMSPMSFYMFELSEPCIGVWLVKPKMVLTSYFGWLWSICDFLAGTDQMVTIEVLFWSFLCNLIDIAVTFG
jgi:hypothetical protein